MTSRPLLCLMILVSTPRVSGAAPPDAERALPQIEQVEGHPVRTLLSPDAIPAIDDPRFVPASKASFMAGDEPVLGVSVGGEARAYSLRQLDWHEIVNDELGGRAIAVTW